MLLVQLVKFYCGNSMRKNISWFINFSNVIKNYKLRGSKIHSLSRIREPNILHVTSCISIDHRIVQFYFSKINLINGDANKNKKTRFLI